MSGEKIMTQITGHGPGVSPLVNITLKWGLTAPVNGIDQGETFFGVDFSQSMGDVRQSMRNQMAAYITLLTGQTFHDADVIGMEELMTQSYGLVPLTVVMSALLASADIERILMPTVLTYSSIILDAISWSVSARALVSGTATLTIKNDVGTTLATQAISSPGVFPFTPSTSTIASGDTLHFGFSGIGIGLSDVCVTGWLKIPLGV